MKEHSSGEVRFVEWSMVACYISQNIGRDESNRKIDKLMELVRKKGEPTIVLGDMNAKSALS